MTITFYKNNADYRKVSKTEAGGELTKATAIGTNGVLTGTLRQPCDIERPTIQLELSPGKLFYFNYIFVTEWQHYYFVAKKRVLRMDLVEIDCVEDYLNTHSVAILASSAYVSRYETNSVPYLADGQRPVSNQIQTEIVNKGSGITDHFNPENIDATSPCFMLALANGTTNVTGKTVTGGDTWVRAINEYLGIGDTGAIRYAIRSATLRNVLATLMSGSISSAFYGVGTDGIINALAFPFDLKLAGATAGATPAQIKMYDQSVGTYTGYAIYPNPEVSFSFGGFKSSTSNSGYLSLEPYRRATLYLPYIGYTDVPMHYVGGNGIRVDYQVDIITGKCQALIYGLSGVGTIYTLLKTLSGQMAVQVPITSTNAAEKSRDALMASLSASMSMAGGTAGAISAARTLSGALLKPLTMHGSVPESDLARRVRSDPFIYIESQKDETPANYGHYVGYPYNKTVTLSALSGYAVVEEIFFSSEFAMEAEAEAVRGLLKGGVIF